jgi:hypothetical protein
MAAKKFYTASLTKTGIEVETVYGTAATAFLWPGNVQNFSLIPSNVTQMNRSQNVNRETHSVDVLQKLYRGAIRWRVQTGIFFLAAFGTLVTTGTGPYTHTFTTGDELPSFSAYHQKKGRGAQTTLDEIYTGCKSNKLTLECSEQGYLEAEHDVMSNGKAAAGGDKAVTALSTTAFRFADITASEAIVGGTGVKIVGFKYDRDNKLTDEQCEDSIAEPNAQELVEALEVTFKMTDEVVRDALAAGVEIEISIPFVRGADTLTLVCQCVPKDAPEDTGVEGPIETTAAFDVRTTTLIVVNSVATYTI